MKKFLTNLSIKHPWLTIGATVVITAFFAVQFPKVTIDTDPENMLPADEPVRLFDHQTKEDFELSDFIAVGVVVEEGAFSVDLLNRIYRITAEIEEIEGVIADDILAPSLVDDIHQGEGGSIVIETLMKDEIKDPQQAEYILNRIIQNPILRGKLASDDGKAIAIFVPIESKNMSRRIAAEIKALTEKYGGGEKYHIAGLPVAEDSFGAEMFSQMAVSAPIAMLVIFLLLLMFFRNFKIVMGPMIVAMVSVIWTMGLLIYTGNTVHIMSSMIPIFLMAISVLDSIHIISEFHDQYKKFKEKDVALRRTINELFSPMLFTSLTTMAGFAFLALTPIPPVQVFGIFVAFGIGVAWLLSMTMIPAVIMILSAKTLRNFGAVDDEHGLLSKLMDSFRNITSRHYTAIMVISALVIIVSGYGLTMIEVNDNPVRWFKQSHPIRQADAIMNKHLAGTYLNYLVFDTGEEDGVKDPRVLSYIEQIQRELAKDDIVGGTTGLTDIVKKIRFELFGADSSKAHLPDNREEIGQLLFVFEMSGGDPDDLFKFTTPDYDKANLWVQLVTGDNQKVERVVNRVALFMENNPPPVELDIGWAGLPYINITWQKKMVSGMRDSLAGSFIVVFFMMVILFRSVRWGLISMLPLTITILAIYGFIGYIGKPYDMPVAVLSSLTLGLSIDFAIHFIQRLRMIFKRSQDFQQSFHEVFENTGRAIGRNVLVIAIGFTPMLFSTLVPYITVGFFFLSIMIVSGLATMLLLPAVSLSFNKSLFKVKQIET